MSGGADRDRTDDLRLAKPALSQLSYSPTGNLAVPDHHAALPRRRRNQRWPDHPNSPARCTWRCEEAERRESSVRPIRRRVARAFRLGWWAWMDLNHRPPAYQADALTN